EWEEWLLA
nr:RecName: Full=Vam6-like protein [Mus musculus]pir/A59495/ Vesicle associated membrane protein - Mus musculus [Mus musculus]